jgi:FAD/FMN-containing dehydrogenase
MAGEAVPPVRRRTLLAAAGAVTGCAVAGGVLGWGERTRAAGPPGARGVSAPPTAADWRRLGAALDGGLVLPTDRGYRVARELFDPTFDRIRPQGVAYCASAADLQRGIAFARQHGLPLALRSGGHSYAGYSTTTGLVLDTSRLRAVTPDPRTGTALVGAGVLQIDLYAQLARGGRFVPGASCATVGIAGLAQGGGIGVLDRQYGLTLDHIVRLEIVTADGTLRTCDARDNTDLFWACRGGGGGNFGGVVSFTFRTDPVPPLAMCYLTWDWPAAVQVLPAWLEWAAHGPEPLWSNCILTGGVPGGTPTLAVSGVFVGTPGGLNPLLDDLQRSAGAPPASRATWTSGFLDAMLSEAGCHGLTVAQCHQRGQGQGGVLARQAFAAKSDFLAAPLGARGVAALLDGMEARGRDYGLAGGAVILDASGGVINQVPADATAYVHRNDLCSVQYYTTWDRDASAAEISANRAWLAAIYAAMRPFVSGYAYQNYIDPDLPDWLHAYYGSNLPRLVAVKRRYDPDDVFHFAQSIPLRLPAAGAV